MNYSIFDEARLSSAANQDSHQVSESIFIKIPWKKRIGENGASLYNISIEVFKEIKYEKYFVSQNPRPLIKMFVCAMSMMIKTNKSVQENLCVLNYISYEKNERTARLHSLYSMHQARARYRSVGRVHPYQKLKGTPRATSAQSKKYLRREL